MEGKEFSRPVEGVYGTVIRYANVGVWGTAEFRRLERKFDLQHHPYNEVYIETGVATVVQRFRFIHKMEDPNVREFILSDLEKREKYDEIIHELVSIDQRVDYGGVDALRRCKELDMRRIEREGREVFSSNTEEKRIHSEAVGAGEDLIIDFLENQAKILGRRPQKRKS